jgi:hypothetical protein
MATDERSAYINLVFAMDWLNLTGLSLSAELIRTDDFLPNFRVLLRDKPFIVKVMLSTGANPPEFMVQEENAPHNMAIIPMHVIGIARIYDTIYGLNQELYQY